MLVSGVGTGGTITGISRYIKKTRGKQILSVAVEPTDSPVISQKLAGQELKPGPHKIQGIGAGFIPDTLDLSMVDRVEQVSNDEAIDFARRLAKEEGILSGISCGAAAAVAARLAAQPEFAGKNDRRHPPRFGRAVSDQRAVRGDRLTGSRRSEGGKDEDGVSKQRSSPDRTLSKPLPIVQRRGFFACPGNQGGYPMKKSQPLTLESRAVQFGVGRDEKTGAISFPIYPSATYRHPGVGESTGFDYTRSGNPTRHVLEEALAELERGSRGLAFSSGHGSPDDAFPAFLRRRPPGRLRGPLRGHLPGPGPGFRQSSALPPPASTPPTPGP